MTTKEKAKTARKNWEYNLKTVENEIENIYDDGRTKKPTTDMGLRVEPCSFCQETAAKHGHIGSTACYTECEVAKAGHYCFGSTSVYQGVMDAKNTLLETQTLDKYKIALKHLKTAIKNVINLLLEIEGVRTRV